MHFTGKMRDAESNLDASFASRMGWRDDFDARYYSSQWGRFMIPDWDAKPTAVPYANFGNPQSLSLYAYVKNNPSTAFDPDGHCGDPGKPCPNQAGTPAGTTPGDTNQTPGQEQESPYQKWQAEQNRPITSADWANTLHQAGQTADAGVKAGLVVVGAEVATVGVVVAAPTVAAVGTQVGTAVNTATTSAYVYTTTTLSTAGTVIANSYRAGVDLARQGVVTMDTLKRGGGAIQAATDFATGLVPGGRTPNNPYGQAGRLVRTMYTLATKLIH